MGTIIIYILQKESKWLAQSNNLIMDGVKNIVQDSAPFGCFYCLIAAPRERQNILEKRG